MFPSDTCRIDFAIVCETREDLERGVAFAAPLRRANHPTWCPLTFRKMKRQMEEARTMGPAYVIVMDGANVNIIDQTTGKRYDGVPIPDALNALLDIWSDETQCSHPFAMQMEDDFKTWMREAA